MLQKFGITIIGNNVRYFFLFVRSCLKFYVINLLIRHNNACQSQNGKTYILQIYVNNYCFASFFCYFFASTGILQVVENFCFVVFVLKNISFIFQ